MSRESYASKVVSLLFATMNDHPDSFPTLAKILSPFRERFAFVNGWPLRSGAKGWEDDAVPVAFDRILPLQHEAGHLVTILNPRLPSKNLGATVVAAFVHNALVALRSTHDAQGNEVAGGGFETFTPAKGAGAGTPVLRSFSPTKLTEFKDAMAEAGVEIIKTPVDPKDPKGPKDTAYVAVNTLVKILSKAGKVDEGPVKANMKAPRPSYVISVGLPGGEDTPLNLTTGSQIAAAMVANAIPGTVLTVSTDEYASRLRNTDLFKGISIESRESKAPREGAE